MIPAQLDLLLFVLVVISAGAWCTKEIRRRKAKGLRPRLIGGIVAGIALATIAVTEYVAAQSMTASAPGPRWIVLGAGFLLIAASLAQWLTISVLKGQLGSQHETEGRLQRAKDIADVRNRAKSEFIAVMSHEIRTPLTAVMGFASVLSETKLDKTQRRYLNTVISATERLVTLLNDILDFSKIEEGKLILERVPFAPALLVHEVMDLLLPKAAEKSLLLHFDNHLGDPLTVEGDPTRVRQILLNLVGNAIKFTDKGSVAIHAAWTPPTPGSTTGRLTVKVSDTGIGIPSVRLQNIFEMFTEASPSPARRFGETGLGLAICHRLIDLMGGRIHAESALGDGSIFTVTLPCPIGQSDTSFPSTTTAPPKTEALPPTRGRVLVVDDQELNRELMRVLVRRLGYEADLAADGNEAAQRVKTQTYALVFMDLEMPVANGFATTAQIRANEPAGRRVPIVAVTANTAPGTREKCLAAGMDDYLTKPVYLPALNSTLEAMTAPAASKG